LSRLVPSMRPIEETASGLWPTPNANNHKGAYTNPDLIQARKDAGRQQNLQDYARWTAMWPTPTSRDHKDGSFCANVETNGLLGRTVWSGPSEPTEKPGALNPEFVSWLMGFPPEWDACAPMAMPSSRKLQRK